MNSSFWKQTGRVWCSGLILFGMRAIQNQTGFDPETGLALPSVAGTALVIGLAVLAALEVLFSLSLSKEKVDFEHHFAPPEKSLTALIIGCMMLVAGGILLALESVTTGGGIAPIVTGALAALTGIGFLVLGRQMRAWDELNVTPTLPSLFFGVFLVLTVYLPTASDPILERYYLPVLAAALVVTLVVGSITGWEVIRAASYRDLLTVTDGDFTAEVEEKLIKMLAPGYITGLTLLGGEPFEPENVPAVLDLVRQVRDRFPNKNIWGFSGYTYEQLLTRTANKAGDFTRKLLGKFWKD